MTTPQPETPATPSAPADDIDALLSDFDAVSPSAVAKPAAAPPVASEPAAAPPPVEAPEGFAQRLLRKAAEREARLRDAVRPKEQEAAPQQNDRLTELEQYVAEDRAHKETERNRAEAQQIFDRAAQAAAEVAPWLPPDAARGWLLNEVSIDGDLATAWAERHASPEHGMRAERAVQRAIQKFRGYVEKLPDPKASDDRALVTSAIRSAAGTPAPAKPPNYNVMSDAEFSREIEAKYGIRSRL